uniref:ATP citrate synthase n=1 Tax=Ascaris lumbricoides TaxID=6252 RepID=A0A0M3IDI4_ASCLU
MELMQEAFGEEKLMSETIREQYIADLDAKTGASLKLTILNRHGRIWTMVAGGGASVVFADTVCDLGGAAELANYGEYSGDPSETQTYEYAKTILGVMTEGPPRPDGKVLIIGGSIANFTNVAMTFKGIVRAFETFQERLHEHRVTIYVRRGGPNYQEGLRKMKESERLHEHRVTIYVRRGGPNYQEGLRKMKESERLHEHRVTIYVRRGGPNYQEGLRKMKESGTKLNLPVYVYGPETHMTSIVAAALGVRPLPDSPHAPQTTGQFLLQPERNVRIAYSPLPINSYSF